MRARFKIERMPSQCWLGKMMMLTLLVALTCGVPALLAGGGPNVSGAKLYIQQNNLDQALSVLMKEINTVNDKNEDAWYLLGYVYARQKKYDDMMDAFNRAVELKSKFHDKGIKIGKDSGTQFHSAFGVDMILKVVWGNAFNSAVKQFNNAVNATDDSSRDKSFGLAIDGFKTAATIMPDSTLAYRNWAAALLNAGRSEESIEPLRKAVEIAPNDKETRLMLAQVYSNNSRDEEALGLLEQLWEEGERTTSVADVLSRIYVRTKDFDGAKKIYQEAILANPDNFQFRYNYGTILLEVQDYDGAVTQLEKAYELDPESPDINYNLGAAYLNRGVSAREAIPEDSEDKSYLADFEAAFPFLEKSIKMNPDDENTWMTLGRIAGQLNKISLAGYAFSKGELERSAMGEKVVVGMPSDALKTILGEPDRVKALESEQFGNIEEWVYRERSKAAGKLAIPEPLNVYVADGRVDALMVIK